MTIVCYVHFSLSKLRFSMNRKFNSQLNNLGTFFKDLKEDVILLDDGKDTSYHRELLRVCTINSLYKLEN